MKEFVSFNMENQVWKKQDINMTTALIFTLTFLKLDVPAASAWSAAPGPMSRWTDANTEDVTEGKLVTVTERKMTDRQTKRERKERHTEFMHSSTA